MKKILSLAFTLIILIAGCLVLTGCGSTGEGNNITSTENNSSNGAKWPTGIAFVPNIEYTGKGDIVYTKDKGDEYTVYIDGATLDSANEYIDKLLNNNYTIMNMFSDEDNHLKEPTSEGLYKLGFDSPDEKIGVVVVIYGDSPKINDIEYNLAITFANMDY